MLTVIIFLYFIFISTESLSIRPDQSIGVTGVLLCNGKPESNVLVKLYDHDTLTLDDFIASGRSTSNGSFSISGTANELSRITPKFNVYHDCNDLLPCQRKLSIYIPKSYTTRASSTNYFYNAGTIELSGKVDGESRDCLH